MGCRDEWEKHAWILPGNVPIARLVLLGQIDILHNCLLQIPHSCIPWHSHLWAPKPYFSTWYPWTKFYCRWEDDLKPWAWKKSMGGGQFAPRISLLQNTYPHALICGHPWGNLILIPNASKCMFGTQFAQRIWGEREREREDWVPKQLPSSLRMHSLTSPAVVSITRLSSSEWLGTLWRRGPSINVDARGSNWLLLLKCVLRFPFLKPIISFGFSSSDQRNQNLFIVLVPWFCVLHFGDQSGAEGKLPTNAKHQRLQLTTETTPQALSLSLFRKHAITNHQNQNIDIQKVETTQCQETKNASLKACDTQMQNTPTKKCTNLTDASKTATQKTSVSCCCA